ncbi:MAG: hypothetical protein P8170_00740 [Gemmatimonadota bacterium]|jgi:hypothetical protein
MSLREDIAGRVEALEEAYEFFLAYAAQGVADHRASKSGGQLRDSLDRATEAVDGIGACLRALVKSQALEPVDGWGDFVDVVERDAAACHAALRLVAAQPAVSSQLVDNLNANIHLRALLTDFFLLDELLR